MLMLRRRSSDRIGRSTYTAHQPVHEIVSFSTYWPVHIGKLLDSGISPRHSCSSEYSLLPVRVMAMGNDLWAHLAGRMLVGDMAGRASVPFLSPAIKLSCVGGDTVAMAYHVLDAES